jgi:formate/nitrite transporter FocA (FNT family)
LFHSVLDSIFMFAGLLTGHADYGYADWVGALGWPSLGNLVGGLLLVTAVRLLRVLTGSRKNAPTPDAS